MSIDEWLERPYVEAAAESDRYEQWCEQEGLDYDSPAAQIMYEEQQIERTDEERYYDANEDWLKEKQFNGH